MTKQEFIDLLYIKFDEISDFSSPGITPLELSKIASNAQEELIMTTYNSKSNKLGEGFEESEKRIQDLGELVRYKSYNSFPTGFLKNSFQVILPNTLVTSGPTDFTDVHWLTIYEDSVINKLDCSVANNTTQYLRAKVEDITHGQLSVALKDPFRKPYYKNNCAKILRLRSEARKYLLFTDGNFTITEFILGYIIKPTPIDLTTSLTSQVSQLAEHKHRELLEATVAQCLKITKQIEQLGVENQFPKE
jgi:hypothetical protein